MKLWKLFALLVGGVALVAGVISAVLGVLLFLDMGSFGLFCWLFFIGLAVAAILVVWRVVLLVREE